MNDYTQITDVPKADIILSGKLKGGENE